jgi:hypothetical protein
MRIVKIAAIIFTLDWFGLAEMKAAAIVLAHVMT